MIEITAKLAGPALTGGATIAGQLRLPFELRQKTRLRTKLLSGEEAALLLPRGEILRGGDLVVAADGRIIEVIAQSESVLHVECDSPTALARAAYHLGNRHVPAQIGEGFLRLAADHVLEEMLRGLGAKITPLDAPFEPEAGAYGGRHYHLHEGSGHGGKIHEFGAAVHTHGHGGHFHSHDK